MSGAYPPVSLSPFSGVGFDIIRRIYAREEACLRLAAVEAQYGPKGLFLDRTRFPYPGGNDAFQRDTRDFELKQFKISTAHKNNPLPNFAFLNLQSFQPRLAELMELLNDVAAWQRDERPRVAGFNARVWWWGPTELVNVLGYFAMSFNCERPPWPAQMDVDAAVTWCAELNRVIGKEIEALRESDAERRREMGLPARACVPPTEMSVVNLKSLLELARKADDVARLFYPRSDGSDTPLARAADHPNSNVRHRQLNFTQNALFQFTHELWPQSIFVTPGDRDLQGLGLSERVEMAIVHLRDVTDRVFVRLASTDQWAEAVTAEGLDFFSAAVSELGAAIAEHNAEQKEAGAQPPAAVRADDPPPQSAAAKPAEPNGVDVAAFKEEPERLAKLPKMPPENAWKAWNVRTLACIKTQNEIVEKLRDYGILANQGQVSRWLKQVDEFMKAGGIAAPFPKPMQKPKSIDPGIIDMGERQDGLTPRQRGRRDPDSDNAE